MMTTGTAFGIKSPQDHLINEVKPYDYVKPNLANEQTSKDEILRQYIDRFVRGEITAEQLEVIKKTIQ